MSRIKLEPKNENHEVVVGLDAPMNTFFITVTEKQDDDDLRDLDPIEFKSRWDRSEVIGKIDEYAKDTERTKQAKNAIFLDMDPAQIVTEPLK
jgi:hypothetical protein